MLYLGFYCIEEIFIVEISFGNKGASDLSKSATEPTRAKIHHGISFGRVNDG